MKTVSRSLLISLAGLLLLLAATPALAVDWPHVKSIWNTLTPDEQSAYLELLADTSATPGVGKARAFGQELGPNRVPADTCGAATNEVGPLTYTDSGDNSALADDYDVLTSVTCSTTFNSTGTEIAYRVQVDQPCDVTVTETAGAYDVVLWAVTDCSDPDNTCVGSSDGGNPESFTFSASVGIDYFVLVDGWNGQNGAYTVEISESGATGCSLVPVELQSFSIE